MTHELTFQGIMPALITPFDDDGSSVDENAIRALVERCIEAGVSGLVPTGSTGEFPTLSDSERRTVAEAVVDAADGRAPTIPGTGTLATRTTVSLSQHAERSGAAAVMVPPPFYEPLRWEELLAHFVAVSDAISIPIVYYNIPGATGVHLSIAQYQQLQSEARVVAIKDTSGDAVTAGELFAHRAELPTVMNGLDTLTFSALAVGVRGAIWGAASFMPEQCVELYRLLAAEHNIPAARELWNRMWPVCRLLETTSYTAAVKTACRMLGLQTGPVRSPLAQLSTTEEAELEQRLRLAGCVPAAV